jgi:hypothetical protein
MNDTLNNATRPRQPKGKQPLLPTRDCVAKKGARPPRRRPALAALRGLLRCSRGYYWLSVVRDGETAAWQSWLLINLVAVSLVRATRWNKLYRYARSSRYLLLRRGSIGGCFSPPSNVSPCPPRLTKAPQS